MTEHGMLVVGLAARMTDHGNETSGVLTDAGYLVYPFAVGPVGGAYGVAFGPVRKRPWADPLVPA
jgi:hypothetical protein